MSRVFVDDDLLSWEAYASGGRYGLPEEAMIVFQCLSDPARRPRFVRRGEDSVAAEQALAVVADTELKELLRGAEALD